MNLEAYLLSKKIDSTAFQKAEPTLWNAWSVEFDQMHPNSFTLQKLNLINPIRRKYPLKSVPEKVEENVNTQTPPTSASTSEPKPINQSTPNPKPSMPKPVFKPKPKIQ